MVNKRIGLYSWAGPTTVKMIQTKYLNAQINEESINKSYDYDYLARAKELFGITDVWTTLYWGFNDETERLAEDFLLSKINNFKRLGLKIHAYVQGTNLVNKDFRTENFWAYDPYNNKIPYYRGRTLTCSNNPEFLEFHLKRVRKACTLPVDGIYIDNVQMGQMTLEIKSKPYSFNGCYCKFCRQSFYGATNENIPLQFNENNIELTEEYLRFKANSITSWILKVKESTKNKELGTNSGDPKFDSRIVYGFDRNELAKIQDYILFEHYCFPNTKSLNLPKIQDKVIQSNKPIFSLPYKNPIGSDGEYCQEDFDGIYSSYNNSNLNICIKGSEFTTQSVWHNLDLNNLDRPSNNLLIQAKPKVIVNYNFMDTLLNLIPVVFRNIIYIKLFSFIINHGFMNRILKMVFTNVVR